MVFWPVLRQRGRDYGKNKARVRPGQQQHEGRLLRDNSLVRLEKVRLPENLVDERGTIALPHMFTQFLKQTKKELSPPRVSAALVLPPSQVICRLVTMPNMTAEQLMMNLPYEFSDFIQGVADQYFCDYALCRPAEGEERENGVPMMAAVAAKNTLAGYYKMFSQAGIRLKTVLPQEMALIQLVQAREGREEFCFVDLGHQFTRITVVWRDRVQATRQIALGAAAWTWLSPMSLGWTPFWPAPTRPATTTASTPAPG